MSRRHGKVFTTRTEAERFRIAVSSRWGLDHGGVPLPRVEDESVGGRRVGRGIHGPWPRTERYADVIAHPERSEWAHCVDDYVRSLDGERVDGTRIDTSDERELDSTWRERDAGTDDTERSR